ncbi:MAG: DNA repair protein RadC [Crocinitomicaceae bacterium]|nr:DNA repair protein RadC [Crocinitomicaceae bacterium]
MNQNFTIKAWAEDDRPREKLVLKGRRSLSDAELIAILIGSGSRNQTAVELAQELLDGAQNSLQEFSKKTVADLCKYKGIGDAKAITIIAAMELGRRRKESEPLKRIKVSSSKVVYDYLKPIFEDLIIEEFHIILLTHGLEIIKSVPISIGGTTGTVADGKVIFKSALDAGASNIILCHNHPSGTRKPSQQDIQLTKNLVNFGKMIGLTVIDHLIYTDNGYFSFSDEGEI